MIVVSLGITVLIETLVALIWSRKNRKPIQSILLTALAGNLLTQTALWTLLLLIAVQHYWLTLLIAEGVIWLTEGALLALVPTNRLRLHDALRLSLWMNLISFGVGLTLPV